MKSKFFTLLTLLLCLCSSGAWATEETLGYGVSGITISGTTATLTSGLTLTQSNSKNLAEGQNVTCDGSSIKSIKFSTGSRNFTITAPTGNEITAITFYSYVNNADLGGGSFTVTSGTEISSTAGTLFTANNTRLTTPDKQIFVFEPAAAVSFSWTGNQLCAVIKVEYFSTSANKVVVSTASNPAAGSKSISGNRDYYVGSTAYLQTVAADGYVFNNWTAGGNEISTNLKTFITTPATSTTYTANFTEGTTHTITAAIADGQSSYGSITNAGSNVVVENANITFAATANEGYTFVKWKKDDEDYSTDASITVTSTADATYTAYFKRLYRVTYDISSYKGAIDASKILQTYSAEHNVNEKYADKDDNYTIPAYAHKYLYNENNRFKKWDDGNGHTYDSGETISGLTADITLTPTWDATTKTVEDCKAPTTVTWNFAKANIVFVDWQSNKYGYYVQNATVDGEIISIPMKIVDGKVANYTRTDLIAQTNTGTKFTIPAVKGMTIAIADANVNFSTTTIAGSTDYEGSGTKSISYTYNGDDATIDIVIGENYQYLKSIAVTYPKVIPGPAAPVGGGVVITYAGGTLSENTWTGSGDCEGYTLSGETLTQKNSTGKFKAVYGTDSKDYTITVPSGIAISNVTIKAYGENDGSVVTIGENNYTYNKNSEVAVSHTFPIATPSAGASIVFNVATKNLIIESITLSTGALTLTIDPDMEGWRTFYDGTQDYEVDEDTKIYVVKEKNGTAGVVTLSEIEGKKVKAATPVILKNTSKTITLTETTGAEAPAVNLLAVTNGGAANGYRLGYGDDGVCFYRYNVASTAAGIVYIPLANVTTGDASRPLTFVFDDDELTGIKNVESVKLSAEGEYFDLSGRRVVQPTKGLYIVNGKKVIIK